MTTLSLLSSKWKAVLAFIPSLVVVVTVGISVDAHYAKAGELYALNQSFQSYRLTQQIEDIQRRIWDIEDRLEQRSRPQNTELRERLRELKHKKDELEREYNLLEKK